MLPLYFYGRCWHVFINNCLKRYVWIPVSMFLSWYALSRITEVSGFKLCCSSESTHWKSCGLWSRACRTCSEAQCIGFSTMFPVLLLPGSLIAWCHFHNLFSKPYSPFWNSSSVHDQPKLICIDAFHRSLHAVTQRLLRRWHLEMSLCSTDAIFPQQFCYPGCCGDLLLIVLGSDVGRCCLFVEE